MLDMTFQNLNDKQREAVFKTDGPVLILAGAGSGKTTVLINRIAYLIGSARCRPYQILAITFTNKAATELKTRLNAMLGADGDNVFASTFHSLCVRILRRDIDKIGYDRSFNIFDRADQLTVVKECLKQFDLDDKVFTPKSVLAEISRAKDELCDAAEMKRLNSYDYRLSKIADVYERYQKRLKACNSLDFDDLIMLTVRLFTEHTEVADFYRRKYQYIMVDEYQDTNHAQYKLVSMLAEQHCNLCVVGDDDQSIYKFRGANIENILSFEKQYSNACVIKLEENYRSTQVILDAANSVIKKNKGRKGKSLWTQKEGGDKIELYRAANEHDEGYYIAEQIINNVSDGCSYSDCAILYRTNSQSRVIENMLIQNAVPYRVLGGLRFFERKEIKDILAYLKLICNHNDDVSLKRIINEPKRGIGAKTVSNAEAIAASVGISLFEVCKKDGGKLTAFAGMIEQLTDDTETYPPSELVQRVLEKTGYADMLLAENSVEATTRLENIKELISDALEFEKTAEDISLNAYLEKISLIADVDNYDESQDVAVLMTLHSAKGLEFPIVFLCGMEEGLFPSYMSSSSSEELEEERRLCYVGITRAKQKLYLTFTSSRTIYGQLSYNKPSRFIEEIPDELINTPFVKAARTHTDIVDFTERQPKNKINRVSLADTVKKAADSVSYSPGERVHHGKFGDGMIMKATAVGNDWHLEIIFDSVGTKNLMAAYAKLKKL